MAGFGSGGFGGFGSAGGGGAGGFGTSNNNNNNNNNNPNSFGGFGSSQTNSGGFGNAPSNTFSGGQQTAAPMFGSSPNVVAPGSATFGGGFGGNTNTPTSGGFGGANPGGGGGGFGNTGGGGFGNSGGGFGNTGFGNTASTNPMSSPFGSGGSQGFGGSTVSSPAASNPFGGNNSENPGLSFGSSSNVITNKTFGNTPAPSSGFGNTPGPSSGFGNTPAPSSGFGNTPAPSSGWSTPAPALAPAQSNNPFGTSSSNRFSNQQEKHKDEMSDNWKGGSGPSSFSQSKPFGGAASNETPQAINTNNTFSGPSGSDEEARLKQKMEEKKRLQAKIEEKKKKLMERAEQAKIEEKKKKLMERAEQVKLEEKKKKLMERAERFKREKKETTLNAAAPAFVPTFAAPPPAPSQGLEISKPREELKNAISLVGTCQYMCPDDELHRRESENDIQLLETPKPGVLHPQNWTLRDTVVKRFRRSAADYKLDVPEWVRPPDVLEIVCAYLEEWVMDRDRQGPDPRFPHNQAPQPLDVYQFIWNRTRMIRKDFTLQNYVGTGGKCDARAVRCHERIARWHALSEHQLTHITEFATAQSQQNIQELGQTLKTLNQFYDDTMNRSLVEVPDKDGKETRMDVSQFSHGCSANNVQGNNPVDYDGSTLNNQGDGPAVSNRLIGKHSVGHSYRGTAEPEMRGLYILLTVNNDGGMEVQKYAARLFKERPAVYESRPVQLALSIYKAKKEYNYARFFHILRSPSTPYLFCCIMFKYVELMRKVAIRIMNKTYGTRKKDGEAIYDAYPLQHLMELLCFEDMDEARTACKHYNITVKPMKVPSSSDPSGYKVVEFIFWKQSNFKEPVHPEKGHTIPLYPRKMVKTIESKLNGATRLGICRGEVSGEGAALRGSNDTTSSAVAVPPPQVSSVQDNAQQVLMEKEAKREELKNKLRLQQLKQEREKKEAEMKRLAELKRQEEEKMKIAHQKEKEKQEMELRRRQKAEALKQRQLEEAQKQEEARAKAEAEKRRRELEEEARKKKEMEDRLRREKERLEREQKLLAERQRQIEIENERKRREAEAAEQERRRRELEAKRQKEAEERRRKEEEERRIKKEWEDRINSARKELLFRRWRRRLSRGLELVQKSQNHLQLIDPTFSREKLYLGLQEARAEHAHFVSHKGSLQSSGPRQVLENLLKPNRIKTMSLSDLTLAEIESLPYFQRILKQGAKDDKITLLLKLGVVMSSEAEAGSMSELVRLWIDSCLGPYRVLLAKKGAFIDVRSVVVHANDAASCTDCDVILFVIPPPSQSDMLPPKRSAFAAFPPSNGKYVVLSLDKNPGRECFDCLRKVENSQDIPLVCASSASADAYHTALELACKEVAQIFVREAFVKIDRVSLFELAAVAILESIWMPILNDQNEEEVILARSRRAISALADELKQQYNINQETWSVWPPREFSQRNSEVEGYFSENVSLPVEWSKFLDPYQIQQEVNLLLQGFNGTFRNVMQGLLTGSPRRLQDECMAMISKWQFRRCLEKGLLWRQGQRTNTISDGLVLYIPNGLLDIVMDGVTFRLKNQDSGLDGRLSLASNNVGNSNLIEAAIESPSRGYLLVATSRPNDVQTTEIVLHKDSAKSQEKITEFSGVDISNKRKKTDDINVYESQGLRDSPLEKRQRTNSSGDVQESSAFTDRLEALLHGDTIDCEVGDNSLSRLLRNVPDITLPRSLQ